MEVYDADLLDFGLNLAHDLAVVLKRPGPLPNTVSQRDVPGTSRAIIPHLRKAAIKALSIGVNFGSAPVVLPSISRWTDRASNTSIFLLYHGRGYGGIATISDFAQAVGFTHAAGSAAPPARSTPLLVSRCSFGHWCVGCASWSAGIGEETTAGRPARLS